MAPFPESKKKSYARRPPATVADVPDLQGHRGQTKKQAGRPERVAVDSQKRVVPCPRHRYNTSAITFFLILFVYVQKNAYLCTQIRGTGS